MRSACAITASSFATILTWTQSLQNVLFFPKFLIEFSRIAEKGCTVEKMEASELLFLLVLDFEANCSKQSERDHEICEFPAVLLDLSGNIVEEFRTFVKPVRIPKISPFIHELTGISDAAVASGMTWAEALNAFDRWCNDRGVHARNTVVVTCGDWDLKTMLVRQHKICGTHASQPIRLRQLFARWTNVKLTYATFKQRRELVGMDAMLGDAGLQLMGRHHSGIDDCRNIAALCRYLMQHGQLQALLAADRNRSPRK